MSNSMIIHFHDHNSWRYTIIQQHFTNTTRIMFLNTYWQYVLNIQYQSLTTIPSTRNIRLAWSGDMRIEMSLFIVKLTRIIQSLYYAPAGRYINAWMYSLKKSVNPEIVNRYDLWVLRHTTEKWKYKIWLTFIFILMSNVKQYDNTFSRPQFLKIYYNTAAFHEYNSHPYTNYMY
jgi:hypothetical protein